VKTRGVKIHRLPEGAELVLEDAASAVLIVKGGCVVRTPGGEQRRVGAGAVLLRTGGANAIDRLVARALLLMQAEPARKWTVERLARAVGLSRAAFARRFVAACGRSPRRHLIELRLALAAALLEECDWSLAEVAQRVGYVSEFAFSRAFKRRYGASPSHFRGRITACAALRLAA
jgi:transcriptional regulator GlxA family with amidase domain